MTETTGPRTVRIVLVDDHPVYRDGLGVLLGSIGDFEVVGVAGDGAEALAVVDAERPDVVVMDVSMPGMDGIEATDRLRESHPEIGVLLLTMSEDDATVVHGLSAGARGYVLKGADQADISRAIRAVADGDAIFGGGIAGRVRSYFDSVRSAASDLPFPDLTPREREILDHIAAGRSNPQIATALYLSPKTVSNNISTIFAKLHVQGRSEAIVLAREAGLGHL
ncbi:DNA-binding response regulator [Nocardioides marmoriginsengisoli]|uniref:DNA-binding response regulator n=1 Tax=Nocardioides marmoriginsengisoli TaxID=661483 RepID=A0A3N0CAW5_9ACTN|nr:response regulator transcription factor [Nocardioides marmoriginsengisoli]RNL60558.1 DNA-binding response regulator [Nocardioides marmoriginsengisoli]